jgi:hypothetical protein
MRKQTNKRSSYKKRGGVNSPSARKTASKRPTSQGLWTEQKEKIIANEKRFRDSIYSNAPLSAEQEAVSEQNNRAMLEKYTLPRGFSKWSHLQMVHDVIRAVSKK